MKKHLAEEYVAVIGSKMVSREEDLSLSFLKTIPPIRKMLFGGPEILALIKEKFPGHPLRNISVIVDYTDRSFLWSFLGDLNHIKDILVFHGMKLFLLKESLVRPEIKRWNWRTEVQHRRLTKAGEYMAAVRLGIEGEQRFKDSFYRTVNTPVVVLSDFGALGNGGRMQGTWEWICDDLLEGSSNNLLLLSPITVCAGKFAQKIIPWNAILGKSFSRDFTDDQGRLMAALSVTIGRVESSMLRAFRTIFSDNPEIEFLIWARKDVHREATVPIIKGVFLKEHQIFFRDRLSPQLQEEVLKVMLRYHSDSSAAVVAEEVLLWSSLVSRRVRERQAKTVNAAEGYLRHVARFLLVTKDPSQLMLIWCRGLANRHQNNDVLKEIHPIFRVFEKIARTAKKQEG